MPGSPAWYYALVHHMFTNQILSQTAIVFSVHKFVFPFLAFVLFDKPFNVPRIKSPSAFL